MKKIIIYALVSLIALVSYISYQIKKNTSDVNENGIVAGDIVFSDGSFCHKNDYETSDLSKNPIAVVYKSAEKVYVVGLMKGNGLMFQTNTSSDINDFEKGYAVVNNITGDFASGWHTPSIDELIDLYENRTVVDDSIKAINNKKSNYADELGKSYYWSNKEDSQMEDIGWAMDFSNGNIFFFLKTSCISCRLIREMEIIR